MKIALIIVIAALAGAVEVPAPPPGAGYLWRGGAWARDPAHTWRVSKATVVRRLKEAGRLVAANAALNGAETPEGIELAETWYAVESVRSDDARARAFLAAIGADAEYAAWVATGESVATKIDSENSLRNVLAKYGIGFQAEKPAVSFDAGPIDKALFEGLFWCVNEIRALKGQGALTRAQALAFLRNFL